MMRTPYILIINNLNKQIMRKNTAGRYTQHIAPNPLKGHNGRSIKHAPQGELRRIILAKIDKAKKEAKNEEESN